MPRYRFDHFVLSPRRRVLTRDGQPRPLIPRYFDLLVFLVERRGDAVPRQEIFDRVWRDVIVSDSALSQAVRTIRRVLDDDSREPRYLRTVSRHGYQFAFVGVVEEADEQDAAAAPAGLAPSGPLPTATPSPPTRDEVAGDPYPALLDRLTSDARGTAADEDRRDAAEALHGLGTATALWHLGTRSGHVAARAVLRDTRWDVAGAGAVPILSGPAPIATVLALVDLRLSRAARVAATRWATAALGAGAAGGLAGAVGGVLLAAAPGADAPFSVVPVLAVLGALAGAVGGAGVGAGLAMAETVARSWRAVGLLAGGAFGGGAVGLAVQVLGRWTLAALVGLAVPLGGGMDGLVLGAAAACGYALGTRGTDGLAAPRGARRGATVALTALACGVAALALAASGRPLVGGTIHLLAQASTGAQVALTPLGRLIGEPGVGPLTAALLALGEGALFGAGLALGLTRRP